VKSADPNKRTVDFTDWGTSTGTGFDAGAGWGTGWGASTKGKKSGSTFTWRDTTTTKTSKSSGSKVGNFFQKRVIPVISAIVNVLRGIFDALAWFTSAILKLLAHIISTFLVGVSNDYVSAVLWSCLMGALLGYAIVEWFWIGVYWGAQVGNATIGGLVGVALGAILNMVELGPIRYRFTQAWAVYINKNRPTEADHEADDVTLAANKRATFTIKSAQIQRNVGMFFEAAIIFTTFAIQGLITAANPAASIGVILRACMLVKGVELFMGWICTQIELLRDFNSKKKDNFAQYEDDF
jgi:hypothetical protein